MYFITLNYTLGAGWRAGMYLELMGIRELLEKNVRTE